LIIGVDPKIDEIIYKAAVENQPVFQVDRSQPLEKVRVERNTDILVLE